MRISDWSSDVCSSDLVEAADESVIFDRRDQEVAPILALGRAAVAPVTRGAASRDAAIGILADIGRAVGREEIGLAVHIDVGIGLQIHRSEEHTSELQSLMRISYAVFCLKKKNKKLTK